MAQLKNSQQFQQFATKTRLGKEPLALSESQAEATAVYVGPRKLLGNFYSMLYVPNPMVGWQLRNAVRRTLHLRTEYFDAAAAAMEAVGLKPGEYGAIHDRQGDFQQVYKLFYFDPKNPQQFLKQPQNQNFVRKHGQLYVASLATPPQARDLMTIFLPAIQREMPEPKRIIRFSDKVEKVARERVGHLKGWQGIIEMIICAQAHTFIGSYGSTFTGYIHRLRGYMPLIADKRMLYSDSSRSDRRPSPSWSEGNWNNGELTWIREWPEGYQF